MKGGNSLMDWLVKLIFFLMLLPFFVSLGLSVLSTTLRMILVFLAAVLPWLIGLFVLAGAVAGLAAAFLRSQLTIQQGRRALPKTGCLSSPDTCCRRTRTGTEDAKKRCSATRRGQQPLPLYVPARRWEGSKPRPVCRLWLGRRQSSDRRATRPGTLQPLVPT